MRALQIYVAKLTPAAVYLISKLRLLALVGEADADAVVVVNRVLKD